MRSLLFQDAVFLGLLDLIAAFVGFGTGIYAFTSAMLSECGTNQGLYKYGNHTGGDSDGSWYWGRN